MPAELPELRTTLQDRSEVAGVLQVALADGVVMIPLDSGPTSMGPHCLALVAPGMADPVEVRAELVGVPAPGLYPLKVSLLRSSHRATVQAFVEATDDVPPISRDGEKLPGTDHRISLSLRRSDLPPGPSVDVFDSFADARPAAPAGARTKGPRPDPRREADEPAAGTRGRRSRPDPRREADEPAAGTRGRRSRPDPRREADEPAAETRGRRARPDPRREADEPAGDARPARSRQDLRREDAPAAGGRRVRPRQDPRREEDVGIDVPDLSPQGEGTVRDKPDTDRPPDSGAILVDLPPMQESVELEMVQLGDSLPPAAANRRRQDRDGIATPTSPSSALAADTSSEGEVAVDVAEVVSSGSGQLVGRVLGNGRYEILEELGEGGMGSVYLAHHRRLDKRIAVKVLHGSLRKDSTFVERFHREALSASKLDHPNVTRVIDFGEEEDGLLYIVMELLDGTELAEIIDRDGAVPLEQAVQVMSEVCAALAAAHENGIIHRDIKPANIVLVPHRRDDGTDATLAKVCDFGIAAAQESGQEGKGRRLTQTGMFHGTPAYMAPEQIRESAIDARSDIYACGVLLFELLTGTLPFDSDSVADLLMMQLRDDPPPPSLLEPTLGPEVDELVLQALAKDPADRQQTARELREQLKALVAGSARRPTPPEPAPATASADWLDTQHTPAESAVTEGGAASAAQEEDISLDLDGRDPAHAGSGGPIAASIRAAPLADPESGFADFVVPLAVLLGAAEPELAEAVAGSPREAFASALQRLLRGRGEITLLRRGEPQAAEWAARTGLGESLHLQQLLPGDKYQAVEEAIRASLPARGIIALTFREGVDDAQAVGFAARLAAAAPGAPAGDDELSTSHISTLTDRHRLGRARRLPWAVDLCVSRLARELAGRMPAELGASEGDELLHQLAYALRPLHTEEAYGLLAHADLVAEGLGEQAGWTVDDIIRLVADACDSSLAERITKHAMGEHELAGPGAAGGAQATGERARRILPLLAVRLMREESDESTELLRGIHEQGLVDFDSLPTHVQLAIRAEQLAQRMLGELDQVLADLDGVADVAKYRQEVVLVEQAMRLLAEREQLTTLWGVVAHLERVAGGSVPGDDSREALAARAARFVADRQALAPIVDALLAGAHDHLDAARALIFAAGSPAAALLFERRSRVVGSRGERARFVGTVREMGRAAVPTIRDALARLADVPPAAEVELLEDLLRAAPAVADDELFEQACRFVAHPAAAIRKAALAVTASAGEGSAREALLAGLADSDELVRAAALSGLRRLGAIGRADVELVAPILEDASASIELRAAAAAVLADADEAAAAAAHHALCRALEAPKQSLAHRLWGSGKRSESAAFVAGVARAVLRLGRPDARAAVERRMRASKGDVRDALRQLLGQ